MMIRKIQVEVISARDTGFLTNTYRWTAPNRRRVEMWYDKRSRNWVVQTVTEIGYEISADTVGTRSDAEGCFADRVKTLQQHAE